MDAYVYFVLKSGQDFMEVSKDGEIGLTNIFLYAKMNLLLIKQKRERL